MFSLQFFSMSAFRMYTFFTSTVKLGDHMAMRPPIMPTAMAAANTWRKLKRFLRNALSGMTAAIVRMHALVTHWTVAASMPNSCMRCGNSTFIIVSVRIPMKQMPAVATMDPMRRPVTLLTLSCGGTKSCAPCEPCEPCALVWGWDDWGSWDSWDARGSWDAWDWNARDWESGSFCEVLWLELFGEVSCDASCRFPCGLACGSASAVELVLCDD